MSFLLPLVSGMSFDSRSCSDIECQSTLLFKEMAFQLSIVDSIIFNYDRRIDIYGQIESFYIRDLIDLDNSNIGNSSFEINCNSSVGVFLFSSFERFKSMVNICVIKDGRPSYFLALNCESCINSTDEVIQFIDKNFGNNPQLGLIKRRILKAKRYLKTSKYKGCNYDHPFCK